MHASSRPPRRRSRSPTSGSAPCGATGSSGSCSPRRERGSGAVTEWCCVMRSDHSVGRRALVLGMGIAFFGMVAGPRSRPDPHLEVDVVVYGATSAGVIAAYTAKTYGKSVLLVEPGRHLGGLGARGLGDTHNRHKEAVTGPGLALFRPPRP